MSAAIFLRARPGPMSRVMGVSRLAQFSSCHVLFEKPRYIRPGKVAPPYKPPAPAGPIPTLSYPDSLVNPPIETLPPPLDTPVKTNGGSKIAYYFNLGKAYLTFYKTGLKNVVTAKKILMARAEEAWLPKARVVRKDYFREGEVPGYLCRAEWILMRRSAHDVLRLPIFGFLLLICGELTPFIAWYIRGVMPGTCRLPSQVSSFISAAEDRRVKSLIHLSRSLPLGLTGSSSFSPETLHQARRHILTSLSLISPRLDTITAGLLTPIYWNLVGAPRLRHLAIDDGLLRRDWVKEELSDVEIKEACVDRGISVVGVTHREQKVLLRKWLDLTAGVGPVEGRAAEECERVGAILTVRGDRWGQLKPGFSVSGELL